MGSVAAAEAGSRWRGRSGGLSRHHAHALAGTSTCESQPRAPLSLQPASSPQNSRRRPPPFLLHRRRPPSPSTSPPPAAPSTPLSRAFCSPDPLHASLLFCPPTPLLSPPPPPATPTVHHGQRNRVLRLPGRAAHSDGAGNQEGLPQTGHHPPPRQEPGRRDGAREISAGEFAPIFATAAWPDARPARTRSAKPTKCSATKSCESNMISLGKSGLSPTPVSVRMMC